MFPSVLNTFTRPSTTDKLNSPSHSGLHNTVSSALGQVEAVIGVDGASSVVGTMMYDLRSPASGGGGHVQVVNKGGTGQTSYTKGDILVASSSSVLTKLTAGSDGTFLVADSSTFTGLNYRAGGVITCSIFTGTSGLWYKPQGATMITVEAWGSGGSGGAKSGSGGAIGGGGGAYATATYPASLIANVVSVVAGASVLGVDGSTNGTAGNTTTFGAYLSAPGGGAGKTTTAATETGANGGQVLTTPSAFGIYGYGGSVLGYPILTPGDALYSSGSGGLNNNGAKGNAGNTIWGGAAGATISSFVGSDRQIGLAGTSQRGGNGGQSSIVNSASVLGVAGAVPGGGGGAGGNTISGNGAAGQVIVYTW